MPTNSKIKRDKRIAAAKRIAASITNLMGWRYNQRRLIGLKNSKEYQETMVRHDLINRMTNWQRNQWGKAGNPMDIEKLKHFCTMPHHKKAGAL
jgi:hypothetical protein